MRVQEVALNNIADKLVDKLDVIKFSKEELKIRVDREGREVIASCIDSTSKTVEDLTEAFNHIKAVRTVAWGKLCDEDKALIRKHAGV